MADLSVRSVEPLTLSDVLGYRSEALARGVYRVWISVGYPAAVATVWRVIKETAAGAESGDAALIYCPASGGVPVELRLRFEAGERLKVTGLGPVAVNLCWDGY